eukprot:1178555-Prorocentrum_minimum.AAC.2
MSYGRRAMSDGLGMGMSEDMCFSSDSSAWSAASSASSWTRRASVALRADCSRSPVGASSSINTRTCSSSSRSSFSSRDRRMAPPCAWSFTRFCASKSSCS